MDEPPPQLPGWVRLPGEDRSLHRRRVRRALLGLLVVAVATGLLAYACTAGRVPRHLTAPEQAGGLHRLPTQPGDDALLARLTTVGARHPLVARYAAPKGDVLLVGADHVLGDHGFGATDLLRLLPQPVGPLHPVTADARGVIACTTTATQRACLWSDQDVVAAVLADLPEAALADEAKKLRPDVER